jgi:YVTN family beta-propeller protein
MKALRAFTALLVVLAICLAVQAFERIDDLTILRNGEVVTYPVDELQAPRAVPSSAFSRGMSDGYVFCSASDDAYPFDLTTHVAGTSIPGYNYPYDAMMNPQGTEIWVADASVEAVIVLDRATNTVTDTIPVGGYTTGIAFAGDGSFALAADRDSDFIVRINTSTYSVIDTITDVTGETWGPGFISYCPGNDRFYAAQWYGDRLFEISSDGTQVLQETPLGTNLWQLVCSHDGTTLYIVDRGPDVLRYFDVATFSEITSVSVGSDPWGVDITPDDSTVVVGCEDSHELYVCDTGTPGAVAIPLWANNDPRDVDISEDGAYAYVPAGPDQDHVLVLDIAAMAVTDSITPLGAGTTNTVSVAPQMGPATSEIVLIGDLVGGQLQLTWTSFAPASAYWVYGASNLAWFVPGFAPSYQYRLAELPPATTTWTSSSGIGDPSTNWTYLVMAVDAIEQELARSNRFGEFDFATDAP